MNPNIAVQALIIHCRCNFSHMIIGTYNMVLSCHFQREYCKNLSYPIIIKGNLRDIGSKFIIKRPDLNFYVFYEITDKIITDYYAFFKFHVYKTIPETFEYDYILEVRYINEDQCDFFISFVYDHKLYLSEKEMFEEMKFRKNLYKNIERALRNFEILKIATVYTTIKSNIELIADILKNLKVIHKFSHFLADQINYDGERIKKNILINLFEKIDNKIYKSTAKVHKCIMNKSEILKEYIIEFLFDEKNNFDLDCSKKKILIIIYEYSGCCSIYLLYFFNSFQKSKENLINFTNYKKRELIKFKNIIEHYNDKMCKKNSKDIDKKIGDLNKSNF